MFFIIDLRLCDDDFENTEGKELCGFELIKEIKRINQGIQIVIFTASKKAENVNKATELGVNRYVLKEPPEQVLTRNDSYALFQDFAARQLMMRSPKVFWHHSIQRIKHTNLFVAETNPDRKDFRERVVSKNGIPDRIFALTQVEKSLFLAEALLNSYKLLERLCMLYFVGSGSVEEKNGNLLIVIRTSAGGGLSALFELKRGLHSFRTKSDTSTKGVEFRTYRLHQLTDLAKMIAVLRFRFALD